MKTLLKLAWRNIFRNPRRTILAGLAVGVSLSMLIFVDGIMTGMLQSMIRTATDTFPGQGQIHAEGFRNSMDVEKTINSLDKVLLALSREKTVTGHTARVLSPAMVTSAANVAPALLYGIDPSTEPGLSKLDEAVFEGSYLPVDGQREILIGKKMAENLEAELGDRIVLTVSAAHTGELEQELFRVSGIFQFGVREADSAMAYIHIDKARSMLGLSGQAHEIALRFSSLELAGDRENPVYKSFSTNGNEAIGWRDIIEQFDAIMSMSDLSTAITLFLIFAIVALIIMNTLFMALHERMFEFGVLRAIGTRPLSMALMIMLEALSLSIISVAIGLAAGALLNWYFSVHGIDYVGIEFGGMTIQELIYPVNTLRQYTEFPLITTGFALLAALYPALYASRLTPAKAMRKSM